MIFALSRTGFPLDIRLWPFVPDVSKKISYPRHFILFDAFTGTAEWLLRLLSVLDKFLHAPLE
jgi:hypothetical protein